MRVALVWLNADGPVGVGHGVLILARELSDSGHEVKVLMEGEAPVLDGGPEEVVAKLLAWRAELVGLSFSSLYAGRARELAGGIRAALPDAYLMCGGIHVTLDPEAVFEWPGVDAIGMGEVDGGPLVELVRRLACKEDPTDLSGFWFHGPGSERRNPMAPLPCIEEQALPLFDAVDLDGLVRAKRGFGEVLGGRGCPFQCRFCQNHAVVERFRESLGGSPSRWPYVRQRSVDNLMNELHELVARAPSLTAIMFADDRLTGNLGWLEEFARRYQSEIGLPFVVNATPDQIDERVAALLAGAGCNMVKIGVECAPGRIRKEVLGRPFGESTIRAAFHRLRAVGVNTMAYLMVGIPGETPEDLRATFRFCADLRPDAVRVSMFCPYPGTSIHRELVAADRLSPDRTAFGFMDGSILDWPPEMARWLDRIVVLAPWLLNSNLPAVAEPASALIDWLMAEEAGRLKSPEGQAATALKVEEALTAMGSRPHYRCPFPERPDYAFLVAPRPRPLINVDSSEPTPGQ